MSILSRLTRTGKPRRHIGLTPPVREIRRSKPATPFGEGLVSDSVRSLKAWVAYGVAFELTEDLLWFEQAYPAFPYTLRWVKDGQADSKGFDSVAEAELYAWHLSEPLPVEEPLPTTYEPAYPEEHPAFEASQSDIEWLATVDEESGLDQWLDSLAPENYEYLGMEGGAW